MENHDIATASAIPSHRLLRAIVAHHHPIVHAIHPKLQTKIEIETFLNMRRVVSKYDYDEKTRKGSVNVK